MKKYFLYVLIILIPAFFPVSCNKNPVYDAVSSATKNKRAVIEPLLQKIMPEAMADGMVKVAIVRNLAPGDYGQQYMESCVAEGRAMGFIVDYFELSGDYEHCRNHILRIIASDYDGIIFCLGGEDLSHYDFLPGIGKRIKIVTFDNLPYRDDDPRKDILYGITATTQDDEGLAIISLNVLIDSISPGSRPGIPQAPIRLISVIDQTGMPPMDSRHEVYDRYIREGRIIEVARIIPPDFAYIRSAIRETLIHILDDFPSGTVDAIWAPYDEYAKGCYDALKESGRREIKMTSIDISNDDIKLMLDLPDQWIASAATDPSLAGVVNMRLLAAKLAGENTPATYTFDAQLVKTSMLTHSITMANIALYIPGWLSPQGLFEYPWIATLKDSVAGRVR